MSPTTNVLPTENLLAQETSPYLVQHKDNPVHWRPWSKAALNEAKAANKPILLSIGYSACHWCHVMAHECFEDDEVAAVMNELFVNIKVDREERPDIDQIFMAALHATGEQGGWPLTMFLTPDGRPFWGGTYFPKRPKYGRPGFIQVMKQVAAALESRKDQVEQNAAVLQNHVKNRLDADAKGVLEPHLDQLHSLAQTVARMIDRENGGFSGAPKFPSAPFMETLFLAAYSSEPSDYRDLFIHSLREMANGGIYDHLGGGLCRYATDSNWLIPHFEKMLYDNAHFIRHCVWAHSFTGEEMFRDRIEKTVSWLEKEMVLESRGIASSLDADSEGEEGKFYVWSKEEVDQVLWEASDVFSLQYEISTAGNWEGKNILHRRHPGADMDENETVLADAKRKLLEKRNLRTRPGLDDKVLVDWNGLMIRSLCEAGRYFRRKDWIDIAKGAFGFIVAKQNGSRLPHSIGKGSILFPGLSSDYSSMMLAAIALHEATGAQDYLDHAKGWARALEEWHGDGNYGFYLTAKDSDDVPIRIRGDSDDAMTSPTGLIIEAMHKLALATGDIKLSVDANRMAASAMGRIAHSQFGQAGIINAAALVLQPIKLVLSGKGQDGIDTVPNRIPDPRRVDVYSGDNATELSDGTLIRPDDGKAYLCLGPVCLPPISDPKQLEDALRNPDIPG